LLSEKLALETEIHGISPFTSSGDEVSSYLANLNYLDDVKMNFEYFDLNLPILNVGYSSDQEMVEVIQSRKWDLIYIDGNHDYEVAKQDFETCSKNLNSGGFIVLDDSSLYTDFKPPVYSTAGHPGPSRVASEINLEIYQEFLSVGHNRVFIKVS
jgi:predicted O-methyltransferase YrrM